MKAFTVAAVQLAPLPGPLTPQAVKGNLAKAAEWVTRCVESTGAELVVLPESVTTGFTPGVGPDERDMLVETQPRIFYFTDHYRDWPIVLIRLPRANKKTVEAVPAKIAPRFR